MRNEELERLSELSINIDGYNTGINLKSEEKGYSILKRFLKGDNVLELGPAEGAMTANLVKDVKNLTAIEGSKPSAEKLKKKYPQVNVVNCLFEEFKPNEKYDFIILGHVLEHVENPTEVLKLARSWLSDKGTIFATVPNSNSIHRQAAVLMKLLETQKSMNITDIAFGHRRTYDLNEFEKDFLDAGFKIIQKGGYWLKPLSNKQIEDDWTDEMVDAFMQLGEDHPEIAAEIYIIAEK